jgi:hypothetical protein
MAGRWASEERMAAPVSLFASISWSRSYSAIRPRSCSLASFFEARSRALMTSRPNMNSNPAEAPGIDRRVKNSQFGSSTSAIRFRSRSRM